jgi:Ni,Fe-hydrogenase I small subunit
MESSMAGAADQARPAAEPAQAAIAAGRTATSAGVPQIQKGEMHQLNLKRVLQLEGPEHLPMQA